MTGVSEIDFSTLLRMYGVLFANEKTEEKLYLIALHRKELATIKLASIAELINIKNQSLLILVGKHFYI